MDALPRVTSVEPLKDYTVRLTFRDGTVGDVDLSWLIGEGPIFAPLNDPGYFRRVRLNRTLGTIVWPNGADVAPETLYARARGEAVSPESLAV